MEMVLLFGVLATLLGVVIVWDARRTRRSARPPTDEAGPDTDGTG
jgi:hypothetical protein